MSPEFIFVGTSGASPGIWKYHTAATSQILPAETGFSPYALDYAPDLNMLAAGFTNSRSRHTFGKMVLLQLSPQGEMESVLMEKYLRNSVLSVCLINNTHIACGTTGGKIRIWNLDNMNAEAVDLDGHNGYVTSLEATSEGNLLSMGTDGVLRKWNTQSGTVIEEIPLNNGRGNIALYQAMCDADDAGTLLAQYPNGTLCSITGKEHEKNADILHQSQSAAFMMNVYVVLSSAGSMLKLCDIASHDLIQEADCSPAIGLTAVSPHEFIVVTKEHTAELWGTEPLKKKQSIGLSDIRGIMRFKRQPHVHYKQKETEALHRELIEKSSRYTSDPDFDGIQEYCKELSNIGLEMESYIFFAEWCMRHNQPLWELQARLNLCSSLTRNVPEEAVFFIALAKLCERLNEPEMALSAWKEASLRDQEIDRVEETINRLESVTKYRENYESTVLDYFDSAESLLQEKRKYEIINKLWKRPFALVIKSEIMKGISDKEHVHALINSLAKDDEFNLKKASFFSSGSAWQELTALEYAHGYNAEGFKLNVTFEGSAGHYEAVYRMVFLPDATSENGKNWQQLEETLSKLDSEHFKKWSDIILNKLMEHYNQSIVSRNKTGKRKF